MSAVRFAIGRKPGLSEHEARVLADHVALGHGLVAIRLTAKIRTQAALHPDRPPPSADIVLDREELKELAAVFARKPALLRDSACAHLRDEVLAALVRPEP